ncbi:MAG: photosynthetic protein synthase I [Methyloprofundus sp.]|nr:photosynthetic protein synthase I [Methyloprofundus sp.]
MQALIFFLIGLFSSHTLYAEELATQLAPAYSPLTFTLPPAASYQLPVIESAADGEVLSSEGHTQNLHDLMGDKLVLLSFIYATCSDVNGCPLATMVFHKINRRLQQEIELSSKLRLLTLSFNPEHDTPAAMARYAQGFQSDGIDWQFLTTQSEQQLQPILDHYRQSIQKVYDQKGKFTGTYSHILRVYLIDRDKQIRNIYSVTFLHADTLINDVKNLLAEVAQPLNDKALISEANFHAGDNKQQYDQQDYQTQSIALKQRKGSAADLLMNIELPPLGLPAVPIPKDNPITEAKIALGRKLFYDRRLSLNNTFSCAMCHIPEQGFSSNEMKTAVGIEGRSVSRNSPTLYNIAYATQLFHDGRENSLEQQVWGPLLAHNEMGNPSIGFVLDKIKSLEDYQGLFEQSFAKEIDMLTVGQALASYQRTLNSANSSFDRWHFAQQDNAVSSAVKRGFQLFTGKAACAQCHRIEASYALFTDNQLHNTGIGYREAMQATAEQQKLQVAPGVFIEVDRHILQAVSASKSNDLGRYSISQNPQDRWKYKTPSLRNIALSAPYMHNGALASLSEVVEFYNQGGVVNENLDPLIKALNLTEVEQQDLVAFLESLTGSNVPLLVSDAYAAPQGE